VRSALVSRSKASVRFIERPDAVQMVEHGPDGVQPPGFGAGAAQLHPGLVFHRRPDPYEYLVQV
jgi:hypothetical protein